MKNEISISFVVPCYNENPNIKKTINEILKTIKSLNIDNFEIIIVDDGSSDNSYMILKECQNKHSNIVIKKHEQNIGYGGAIKTGFNTSRKEYIMWIPGDNSHSNTEISKMITSIGKYDLITTYYTNKAKRNLFRRLFTKVYTPFLNFIFRMNLPYYNGLTIYKKTIIEKISIYTNSFTWQIELLMKIFKTKNVNFTIIPTKLDDREEGKSKAFKIKNSIYVIFSITRLYILQFIIKKEK